MVFTKPASSAAGQTMNKAFQKGARKKEKSWYWLTDWLNERGKEQRLAGWLQLLDIPALWLPHGGKFPVAYISL